MKINITENLNGHNLLEELFKKINFGKITLKEKNDYIIIQKVCLYDLENEDNIEKHITSYKPNEDQLEILNRLLDEIVNIEIKARIYDILQANKKNVYDNCLNAYQFYSQLTKEGNLNENRAFFIRSIEVLKVLGTGQAERALEAFDKIKNLIIVTTDDQFWYSQNILICKLYYLSLSTKAAFDFTGLITFINGLIEIFIGKADYRKIQLGYETLKVIDKDKLKKYHFQIGKCFEDEADEIIQKQNSNIFLACSSYKRALSVYSKLGNNKDEVSRVKQKLVEANKNALSQMLTIEDSIPPNGKKLSIIDDVKFQSFEHAIFWLIHLASFPGKRIFEERLIQYKKSYYHLQYFSSKQLNSKGNTIGISKNNDKLVFREASRVRSVFVSEMICPALQKIQEQYVISYEKVLYILYGSEFIQNERFELFAYAIYQGFIGNFLVATHLLLPQIENSLRYLLQKEGVIPTKLNEEIQEEILLSSIIGKNDSDGKLKGIVSDDLIFDLQSLLNEPFGDNLRNEVVHGLCEVNKLNGASSIYLWWLSLKLSLTIDYFIEKKVE